MESTSSNAPDQPAAVYSDIPESWLYEGLSPILYSALRWLGGVTVEGLENLPANGHVIVAATHRAAVHEIVAYAHLWQRPTAFVATQKLWTPNGELGRLGRPLLNAFGAIPVVQGVGFSPDAFDRIDRISNDNGNLFIFPEGRIRSGREVKDIHPGVAVLAARYGAQIVTMAIAGLELNDFGNIHAVIRPAFQVERVTPPPREPFRSRDRGRDLKLDFVHTARIMKQDGSAARIEDRLHGEMQAALDRAYELRDSSNMNLPRRVVSRIIRERHRVKTLNLPT